jgi:hypothetical protein
MEPAKATRKCVDIFPTGCGSGNCCNWGPAFVAPAFKLQLHFAILNLGPGGSRSILAVL